MTKKLKTSVALLLLPILCVGCGINTTPTTSNDTNMPAQISQSAEKEQTYYEELNRIKGTGNVIYSPTSARTSYQMYSYMTDENTKTSIQAMLGDIDYFDFKDNNDTTKFVNRIWLNSSVQMNVDDKIKNCVYSINMSDSQAATKEKNDYVSQHTNGFISSTPTILDESVEYDLMNITYFKDTWKESYKKLEQAMKFNNSDGTITNVDKFIATTEQIYENNSVYFVAIDYKDGNKFWLVYPKTTINDINLSNLKKVSDTKATLHIPEFDMENTFDLTDTFDIKEAGVAMTQVAKIKVDNEGTEAAAVTETVKSLAMKESSDSKQISLEFDKPFIYFIEDTVNGDYIFIGRMENFN